MTYRTFNSENYPVTSIYNKINEDGVSGIWEQIKPDVADIMFEDYSIPFKSKDDPTFIEFIDQGEWLNVPDLKNIYASFTQSKGYTANSVFFANKSTSNEQIQNLPSSSDDNDAVKTFN